ncbi:pentapeptide repeat-containing protein [Paenibacillus gorillae]|uniref:pentapeptide repeat-containing protein n=1 Tax=Paenibacillus gorillae TaxID=1243662 RepID=UPI00138AFD40|nr:pentapeptide repeat-containing protein [Paenibacillus gorillae]
MELELEVMEQDSEFVDRIVQDCELYGEAPYKACFDRMKFTNVTMRGARMRKSEFTDVIFERCDLSNADFQDAIFHRVVFKDCKLIGMDLSSGMLRNASFIDCHAEYAVFRMINAKRVRLHGGTFAYGDFFNSNLTEFYLEETRLDQAQFSQTKLSGIDLSSCEFDSLGATLPELRGCIISPLQAAAFAGQLGMVVKR